MGEIDYSTPFTVRIIQDCRYPEEYGPSGKLDGKYGTCLGLYEFPNTWKKARNPDNVLKANPLILTDSGDYIWGAQCWWDPNPKENSAIPLDLLQRVLELHKKLLRKQSGIEHDSSLN
ncbi:hypothetical protein HY486_01180 [Candidatus Woesearchaeota archaeon]|nr:hypothetical protein [Candidatus Woesearchaeota archaeon]